MVTLGTVLIVGTVSGSKPEVPARCPVEVGHALSQNGKAIFTFTNQSRFDVIVDWPPDLEVQRRERWEFLPSRYGAGQARNKLPLGAHEATSCNEVALRELRR